MRGEAADALLRDPAFQARWAALHRACPWATVFQSAAFARTWYAVYRWRAEPLLVCGTDAAGALAGLFTLAVPAGGDIPEGLMHAGAPHAEYEVWLARPEDGATFITAALECLAARFPAGRLGLRYLPPGAPLDWAAPGTRWARHVTLRPWARPLLAVGDGGAAAAALRKPGNRSRLTRLAQGGALRFERLRCPEALGAVLPTVAAFSDVRHGAVHDELPFRDDPLRAPFYHGLLVAPGLPHATVSHATVLHATVLRQGEEVVSAHLGIADRRQVSLGVIAHSPVLARHSPGKLHLHLLAAELAREGYATFDLTPGGDAYKERFATHHDTVHSAEIVFSRAASAHDALRQGLRQWAAAASRRLLGPVAAGDLARALRRAAAAPAAVPAKLARRATRAVFDRVEFRLYRMPASVARGLPATGEFRRDHLPDLLAYDPAAPEAPYLTRAGFLQSAAARLAEGLHVYTAVEDGVLVHYGWMTERQARMFVTEVGLPVTLPPNAAVAWDDWTHPRARGRGLQTRSVQQRLRDGAAVPGTECIVCGLVATNGPSRHDMEKVGFVYWCSLFTETRLGRVRRWSGCGG